MTKDYINIAAKEGKEYLIASKKVFQRDSHKMAEINHYQHNMEPNFWNIMLKDLQNNNEFIGKSCLEYGCGAGRNLVNMSILGGFTRADGIKHGDSFFLSLLSIVSEPSYIVSSPPIPDPTETPTL